MNKTLRLAVGMRGGVSLAVWIGGAVSELEHLRNARADGTGFYSDLLRVGRYDRVELDVMSGASAGGLNAVLAAAAMLRGRSTAGMRQVWIEVADLRRLLEAHEGGDRDRRSLLGGEYFRSELEKSVRELLGGEPGEPGGAAPRATLDHRLEVFLSATVLDGMPIGIPDDPYSPDHARRSAALFHFRHFGNGRMVSDLVVPAAADDLVRAARTTASYPAAFEPVLYCPGDLRGLLLLPGPQTDGVRLLDGGVVDNIPVARAIQGVPNVPSATPTDRWLMYLHPSPGAPEQARKRPSTALIRVLFGLGHALRSESILDDIEAIRRHNAAAITSWRAWTASVGTLPTPTALPVLAPTPSALDAVRIYELLREPSDALVWRPIGAQVPASPLDGCNTNVRREFRRVLDDAISEQHRPLRPYALLARSAGLLTRWSRLIEDHGDAADAASLARAKQHAYQVMQLAQLLNARSDWHLLTTTSANVGSPGTAPLDPHLVVSGLAKFVAALDADPALEHLAGSLPIEPVDLAMAAPFADPPLPALYECTYQPEPGAACVEDVLWRHIGKVAVVLAAMTQHVGADSERVFIDLAQALEGVPDACRKTTAEQYLRLIDQRTAGVHCGRPTGQPPEFRYLRAAGSSPTPLGLALEAIYAPRSAQAPPRFAGTPLANRSGAGMQAKTKLAGGDLANFSAFISRRWRANDWMWGRLDAAKSIVDLTTSPDRLGGDPDTALASVRNAIIATPPGVADPLADELRQWLKAAYRTHQKRIAYEITFAVENGRWPHEPEEPPPTPASPDDWVKGVVLCKALLVLRRQWTILAEELPVLLATPLRPGEAAPARAPGSSEDLCEAAANDDPRDPPASAAELQRAIDQYEASPRSVRQVWGHRWLSALGVRAAYALWTATRPASALRRYARSPLKPLPMATIGMALARHRTLVAVALTANLILLPRLSGIAVVVVWLGTTSLCAALAWIFRARPASLRSPHPMPLEPWGQLCRVVALAAVALGGVFAFSTRARRSWYDGQLTEVLDRQLDAYTVTAALAAGLATWALWSWARNGYRFLMAATVTALFWTWAAVSRWPPEEDAGWLREVALRFGSMWWALLLAIALSTGFAHFGIRYFDNMGAYDRD